MKEAIINYINARSEAVRSKTENSKPCKHKWELLLKKHVYSKLNKDYTWHNYTYRCKKCGKINKFDTQYE